MFAYIWPTDWELVLSDWWLHLFLATEVDCDGKGISGFSRD